MSAARPEVLAHARRQGKRVAVGFVSVVSVVFVAASAWQIVQATFGLNVSRLPPPGAERQAANDAAGPRATSGAGEPASAWICAAGIRRRLDSPVDRDWPDETEVRGACEKSPEGLDAWASLARLRRAEEELAGDASGELQALRRDVAAHLPTDLR